MDDKLRKKMNALRQCKEFQRAKPNYTTNEDSFVAKLTLLRKKYPNDAIFGAEVDKLLKDGNNI